MSQEGLVSSNHYVVRIYPLALPPVSLFPSLHPSRLFPSLCSLSTGCPTTLQHPPFFNHHRLMHHLSSRFPGTHSFVNSFIFIFCLPTRSLARSPSCLLPQIASTGLPLKYSLGQAESVPTVSFPSGMCSSLKL